MDCFIQKLRDYTQLGKKYGFSSFIHDTHIENPNFNVEQNSIIVLNQHSSINLTSKTPTIYNTEINIGGRTDVFNDLVKLRDECGLSSSQMSIIVYGKDAGVVDLSLKTNDSSVVIFLEKGLKVGKQTFSSNRKDAVKTVSLFVLAWVILGIIAFVLSLLCFTKTKGTLAQNVIGLLIAILFGPFYFIYYYAMKNKGYCMNE